MEERFVGGTGNNSPVVSLADEKRRRAEEAFEFLKRLIDAEKRKTSIRGLPDSLGQIVYDGAREAVRAGASPRRLRHEPRS